MLTLLQLNVIALFFKRSLYRNYFSNRFFAPFFLPSLRMPLVITSRTAACRRAIVSHGTRHLERSTCYWNGYKNGTVKNRNGTEIKILRPVPFSACSTSVQHPFNCCSNTAHIPFFERAPVARIERGNFFLPPTVEQASLLLHTHDTRAVITRGQVTGKNIA